MKIKEGFNLRKVGDENVIVAQGVQNVNFSKIISLNQSAAYLWNAVKDKEFSTELLAELLVAQYEVEEEVARNDAKELAKAWMEAGIIS